ncbi:hypothetical protein [Streptomyces drozdowiczii]|uniref:hypothetical protein n=1 Tax=Streptomyces drozdowiczii TaxID=202862 RepID=UPI0022485E10|nr:hypothetical protein [Streptomyces drozdowiczii]MCX0246573.1 hypothetical protein [Streptomyces drozdowiczii]
MEDLAVRGNGEVVRLQPAQGVELFGVGAGWCGAGAGVGGEAAREVFREGGELVGGGQDDVRLVFQHRVAGGVDEDFRVAAQGPAGLAGADHRRVRGSVHGVGAGADELVEVGGGQPARLGLGVVENRR